MRHTFRYRIGYSKESFAPMAFEPEEPVLKAAATSALRALLSNASALPKARVPSALGISYDSAEALTEKFYGE